jgi:hypothetical protein
VCSSPGMEHNFHVLPANIVTNFGVPYDYGSIMHYGPYAFTVNGLPTIVPTVSQLLYLFSVTPCVFSGKICVSSLKP